MIEKRQEKPLLALLDTLGGWPVLDGEHWNEADFDWIDLITKLRQYNNDILVALWVGPDGKDSGDYIIQVLSSQVCHHWADFTRAFSLLVWPERLAIAQFWLLQAWVQPSHNIRLLPNVGPGFQDPRCKTWCGQKRHERPHRVWDTVSRCNFKEFMSFYVDSKRFFL